MKIIKIAKKHTEDFSYGETRDLWNTLIFEEQDRVNIKFDLENNDSVEDMKIMNLDFTRDESSYRILYQRCQAGGDWEASTTYFKCQIESKYKDGQFHSDWKSIFIPVKGNINLVKSKEGGFVSKDSERHENLKPSDITVMKESLKKEIPKRIKLYYSSMDYDKGNVDQFKECGLIKDLLSFWKRK